MKPSITFRPADLVLTCSHDLASSANRLGQLLLSGKSTQFTHVAICMGGDVLLDARPFVGVGLRNMFDEVQSGRFDSSRLAKTDMLVVRNPTLTISYETMDDTIADVVRPLFAQLRKKYNWFFQVPQASDSSPDAATARRAFCSELCVLMLHYLSVLPATWVASRTYPAHFQELLSAGWADVTDEWRAELQSIERAIDAPWSEHGLIVAERRRTATRSIIETEGWADVQKTLAAMVNNMSTQFDELLGRARQQKF